MQIPETEHVLTVILGKKLGSSLETCQDGCTVLDQPRAIENRERQAVKEEIHILTTHSG
jgi:hypothetical protein